MTASAASATPAVRARITAAFTDAGTVGQLYAVDVDSGASVGVGADTEQSTASVHKIALIAALYREASLGRVDVTRRVEIPTSGRSPGPTGLAVMRDAAALSLRDLASLAVAVSDNTAADVLWDALGLDTVNRTMAELGLTRTVAVQNMRELYATMAEDAGGGAAALADPGAVARLRVLDPSRTNRSTPRETASLLAAIWRDEVCEGERAAEYGAELRALLGLQAWSHRLASGFPFDDVRVSGKTGSLPTLRHEAGVVEYPDGGRYAVAVFTRAASTAVTLPPADAAIGRAARIAVDALRV
ncbi:serine hydrolase [Streptomyces sp. NPDC051907]|uniref:serine hydrolase n=1 Tax=Streptomyces sp. NPDC051907 TaxID=3155284 RepID=UPI003433A030